VGGPRAMTLSELRLGHEHIDYLDFDIQVSRRGCGFADTPRVDVSYLSAEEHTSAYVSIRTHASACGYVS
jgi:hypothetical protein